MEMTREYRRYTESPYYYPLFGRNHAAVEYFFMAVLCVAYAAILILGG